MPTLVLVALLVVAAVLVLAGLAWMYPPVALVAAGACLAYVVLFVDFSRPKDGESS